MGPLLNFKGVTSFSYKISLIKCLIDRFFKISNNWSSFHDDIESVDSDLIKNAYPPFLIDKVIKTYLDQKFSSNKSQLKDTSYVYYFKLPYIGNLLHHIKNKLSKLCKKFCKENFKIKLVFNSFKIKNYFSYKDSILDDLKCFRVYKFTCASCSSSYIGKTCRYLKTRIEEHIKKDNKSHIFKRLHSTKTCFDSYNSLFFLKQLIKLTLNLTSFSSHTSTIACVTPLFLSVFVFCCLSLSSIIFIISGINYQHLLLS